MRRDLIATKPCGCLAMVQVLESNHYKADAKDISDFWKQVHKVQTRKRKPMELTVREVTNPTSLPPIKCDQCRVSK